MSWAVGYDGNWERDIGYGVPSMCDHPGCDRKIDRGLGYVCCKSTPYGGDGCGLFFCGHHADGYHRCARCVAGKEPFEPTPDLPEWIEHKATDPSWADWRDSQSQNSGDPK